MRQVPYVTRMAYARGSGAADRDDAPAEFLVVASDMTRKKPPAAEDDDGAHATLCSIAIKFVAGTRRKMSLPLESRWPATTRTSRKIRIRGLQNSRLPALDCELRYCLQQ